MKKNRKSINKYLVFILLSGIFITKLPYNISMTNAQISDIPPGVEEPAPDEEIPDAYDLARIKAAEDTINDIYAEMETWGLEDGVLYYEEEMVPGGSLANIQYIENVSEKARIEAMLRELEVALGLREASNTETTTAEETTETTTAEETTEITTAEETTEATTAEETTETTTAEETTETTTAEETTETTTAEETTETTTAEETTETTTAEETTETTTAEETTETTTAEETTETTTAEETTETTTAEETTETTTAEETTETTTAEETTETTTAEETTETTTAEETTETTTAEETTETTTAEETTETTTAEETTETTTAEETTETTTAEETTDEQSNILYILRDKAILEVNSKLANNGIGFLSQSEVDAYIVRLKAATTIDEINIILQEVRDAEKGKNPILPVQQETTTVENSTSSSNISNNSLATNENKNANKPNLPATGEKQNSLLIFLAIGLVGLGIFMNTKDKIFNKD